MIKILMVCLGNICRSPLAEGILKEKIKLSGITRVEIDSAGTAPYHIGHHPDSRSIANAMRHGIDISGLKGRQISKTDLKIFNYIYVMDRSNYDNVIQLSDNEEEREKVKLILEELYPGQNKSVPDPYYGSDEGFEEVYQLLDKACDAIILKLKNNLIS